ncbi:MAG: hypothetical protein ACP5HU_05580 [Phycisphaerae bacterium]
MRKHLKVLFDECVSSRQTLDLIAHGVALGEERETVTLTLLPDFMRREGALDRYWIPRAKAEGYSLIVTGDKGNKKRGDKLPEICVKEGFKHIVVSTKLRDKGGRFIALAIMGVWYGILESIDEADLRYQLRLVDTRKQEVGRHRIALMRRPLQQ